MNAKMLPRFWLSKLPMITLDSRDSRWALCLSAIARIRSAPFGITSLYCASKLGGGIGPEKYAASIRVIAPGFDSGRLGFAGLIWRYFSAFQTFLRLLQARILAALWHRGCLAQLPASLKQSHECRPRYRMRCRYIHRTDPRDPSCEPPLNQTTAEQKGNRIVIFYSLVPQRILSTDPLICIDEISSKTFLSCNASV